MEDEKQPSQSEETKEPEPQRFTGPFFLVMVNTTNGTYDVQTNMGDGYKYHALRMAKEIRAELGL